MSEPLEPGEQEGTIALVADEGVLVLQIAVGARKMGVPVGALAPALAHPAAVELVLDALVEGLEAPGASPDPSVVSGLRDMLRQVADRLDSLHP